MNSEKATIHRRVTLNSISNVGRYFVYVSVAFLMTPYIIRHLGNSHYGLWILILSFIGYAGLLEFGVQTAIVKLVAEYKASEQTDLLNGIVNTALALFAAIGVVLGLGAWLGLPLFLGKIVQDPAQTDVALRLVLIIGIDICIVFPNYVFSGIIYGLQYYYLKSVIDIVVCLSNAVAVYLFLGHGRGIYALAVIKAVADLLGLVLVFFLCRSVYKQFSLGLRHVNRSSLRELFRIGGRIASAATMARIADNAEPLIITSVLSTAWTAIFSVPRRLVEYAKDISWATTTGFMPMFSDLHGRKDRRTIMELYVGYTRYLLLGILPLLVLIGVHGAEFIRIWISNEYYEKGKDLLYLCVLAFYVESLQPLMWRLFIGVGNLNLLVKVSSVASLIYIVLAFLLTRVWGINGMGLALVGVTVFSQGILFRHASRELGLSLFDLFRRSQLAPILCSLAYGVLLYGLQQMSFPRTYAAIAFHAVVSCPAYLLIAYLLGLTPEEKSSVRSTVATACRQASWTRK